MQKDVKLFIFMRNLYFHFAAEQCRPVLRQWCLNPKEIEGKNWNCRKVNYMKKVVCTSSFAKKGHEPLYPMAYFYYPQKLQTNISPGLFRVKCLPFSQTYPAMVMPSPLLSLRNSIWYSSFSGSSLGESEVRLLLLILALLLRFLGFCSCCIWEHFSWSFAGVSEIRLMPRPALSWVNRDSCGAVVDVVGVFGDGTDDFLFTMVPLLLL